MGYLHYGGVTRLEFDDRLLTHLRSVLFAKLHLGESTVLTWSDAGQQQSVWVHPSIPLHFEFASASTPDLNPRWVELLMQQANSSRGLRVVPEPLDDGARSAGA